MILGVPNSVPDFEKQKTKIKKARKKQKIKNKRRGTPPYIGIKNQKGND